MAQDGDLFLANTGRHVPGKPVAPDWLDLLEGRVYDSAADNLEPQHGGPLPVGSYLNHGEWLDVTLPTDQVGAMEARISALIADEPSPSTDPGSHNGT